MNTLVFIAKNGPRAILQRHPLVLYRASTAGYSSSVIHLIPPSARQEDLRMIRIVAHNSN